jgi:nucleotide-binding universal stress UspA family protein
MKNILVGIDFSKGSIHALEYAINLANIIRCDIIMLWVDKQLEPDSIYSNSDQHDYKEEASQNIAELIETYGPLLTNGQLHYKLRRGKVSTEVAVQAKLSKSLLIVTGTHGSSGFEEYWIGSNAFRLVTSASCPVITIRSNYLIPPQVKHILMSITTSSETMQKVPIIIELAKALGSEVFILGINPTTLQSLQKKVDDNVRKVEAMLLENNIPSTVEMVKDINITSAILSCAERIETDLIAIMTELEPSESSLMMGPHAQQIINQSSAPVLSIQPQK